MNPFIDKFLMEYNYFRTV